MWGRKRKDADAERPSEQPPQRLRDARRKARVDQAERSAVVVDLHDAEVARLELLNEALDPLFEEVPKEVDLFDRGISRGETPRLWIDAIAHVCMGPDKRVYRFLQETRYGRKVLAGSVNGPEIVHACPNIWRSACWSASARSPTVCCPARAISSTRCAPSAASAA